MHFLTREFDLCIMLAECHVVFGNAAVEKRDMRLRLFSHGDGRSSPRVDESITCLQTKLAPRLEPYILHRRS